MSTLKVLSLLLSYPQPETHAALGEMAAVVAREEGLPARYKAPLLDVIERFAATDVMALQQDYVALFDRGRALSLHLFEHIHGESRDRGQAMVDLMEIYRAHGFVLSARELPDYIPLFLEYLSQVPPDEGLAQLRDAMPILSLIGARLAERGSVYHVLLDALEGLAGVPDDAARIRATAAAEGPDETLVNMDRIWEEEAVTFLAPGGACPSRAPAAAPVHWVSHPKNASL